MRGGGWESKGAAWEKKQLRRVPDEAVRDEYRAGE